MTLSTAFENLRAAHYREPYPDLATRLQRIDAVYNGVRSRRDQIVEALSADYSHRSVVETRMAEMMPITVTRNYIRKNLKRWMRAENRPVGMALKPGSGKIFAQPLGVVGVLSPWNYPFGLSLGPLLYAVAAGNRVMVKPSEMTPHASALMAEIVEEALGADVGVVVQGGPDVASEFCSLPFDHIFFTGSTRVGKLVMQAAAKNLTPVTLEMGGKSPVVMHPEFPVERAGPTIASGTTFNAGQQCVAVDYVICHARQADALVESIAAHLEVMYPTMAQNDAYTGIINGQHLARLQGLISDAKEKGATIREVNPANEDFAGTGKLAPTIIRNPTADMLVMQEEIFGPVLPIVEVQSLDEAFEFVRRRPSPLAFYLFSNDAQVNERAKQTILAGGMCINEVVLHATDEALPFGGVGPSGMGATHGPEGFFTFSHRKAVLHQARISGRRLWEPPYGWIMDKALDATA